MGELPMFDEFGYPYDERKELFLAEVRAKEEAKPRLKDGKFNYTLDNDLFFRLNPEEARERMKAFFEAELEHKVNKVCMSCPAKEIYMEQDMTRRREHMIAKCGFGSRATCPDELQKQMMHLSREGEAMQAGWSTLERHYWNDSKNMFPDLNEEIRNYLDDPIIEPSTTADIREDFGSW